MELLREERNDRKIKKDGCAFWCDPLEYDTKG